MEDYYTRGEKEFLLKIARATLEKYLVEGERYEPQTVNQKLWEKWGVFVSLYKENELRGCVGFIEPLESLIIGIRDNTIASVQDQRFSHVDVDELKKLKIEISILGELEKVSFDEVRSGDGVVIKMGNNSATYLPQVWQSISQKEDFFNNLCQKAGLEDNCYRDNNLEIHKYQTVVFKEGSI